MERLQDGVFEECPARLFRRLREPDVRRPEHPERQSRGELSHLLQFPGVLAGQEEVRGHACYHHCIRGVAQPGSAPALGAGGRRFKSARPDQHLYMMARRGIFGLAPPPAPHWRIVLPCPAMQSTRMARGVLPGGGIRPEAPPGPSTACRGGRARARPAVRDARSPRHPRGRESERAGVPTRWWNYAHLVPSRGLQPQWVTELAARARLEGRPDPAGLLCSLEPTLGVEPTILLAGVTAAAHRLHGLGFRAWGSRASRSLLMGCSNWETWAALRAAHC